MGRKPRATKITDGTPVQVWLSKDILHRFEKQRKSMTDAATGRGPSRAALAEALISEALIAREFETKQEGAA